jgi:hypothetical protein
VFWGLLVLLPLAGMVRRLTITSGVMVSGSKPPLLKIPYLTLWPVPAEYFVRSAAPGNAPTIERAV